MGKQTESEPALPAGLKALYEAMRGRYDEASTGVDSPEAIARMVVLDAIKMFVRLTGRPPRLIYVPRALEATLQVDRGRNLGLPSKSHGKIRDCELVFTIRPIWDAKEFKLE